LNRFGKLLAGFVIAGLLQPTAWSAPPPGNNTHSSTGAEGESGTVNVLGLTNVKVFALGQSFNLKVHATSLVDEFLVVADAPELARLGKMFRCEISWNPETLTLTCKRGPDTRSMKLDQDRVERSDATNGSKEAELAVPMQMVDGAVHMPMSALEEFLDVRMTVRPGQLVYIEPLIRNVRFEGSGSKTRLVVESTAPVHYRTFTLKSPDRFVVDVFGAVLDTSSPTVNHPDIGNVRLGQFELGPAISRIVVPTQAGIDVRAPKTGSGDTISFKVEVPKQSAVEAPHFAKVTSVQWVKTPQGGRLVVDGNQPLRYEWQRLPDNRVVIDIPHAILTDPKQEFPGGVDSISSVRVVQNQPAPNPSIRVVLDLTKPLEVSFGTGETEDQLQVEVLNKEIELSTNNRGVGATKTNVANSGGGLIVLDAGHGGSDPGAQNKALGLNEATVTLDITKRLATLLKQQGWTVLMTRTSDVDVSYWGSSGPEELGARVKIANERKADLFLSIHCNSSVSASSNGTSLHYFKQGDRVLAGELQSHVVSATGRANRGLQANRFYVLKHSQMPAVLVETAFLSHPQEGALLADPNYRQKIAEGIAQGLRQYAQRNLHWTSAKR
jgi:N-acetylmuramoyl-L-alanine amidase